MEGAIIVEAGVGRGSVFTSVPEGAVGVAGARHGLAEVVTSRRDLADALRRALDAERRPDSSYAGRPSAAAPVLELAARRRPAIVLPAPR